MSPNPLIPEPKIDPSPYPSPTREPSAPPALREESRQAAIARAEGARNLCFGLSGTTIAILTFTLFFLYPQYHSGIIRQPLLFHLTVGALVVALFFFGYASYFYSRLMVDALRGSTRTKWHLQVANSTIAIAIGLVLLSPALVLFTIGLNGEGILALGLWLALEVLVTYGRDAYEPIELSEVVPVV